YSTMGFTTRTRGKFLMRICKKARSKNERSMTAQKKRSETVGMNKGSCRQSPRLAAHRSGQAIAEVAPIRQTLRNLRQYLLRVAVSELSPSRLVHLTVLEFGWLVETVRIQRWKYCWLTNTDFVSASNAPSRWLKMRSESERRCERSGR